MGVIVVRSDHQGWEDGRRRKERHKVAAVFAIHMASHGIEGAVKVRPAFPRFRLPTFPHFFYFERDERI